MDKFKYLLSAILFSLILTTYAAEQKSHKRKLSEKEIVGLDEELKESTELETEKKQKSELKETKFTLISSEGQKFQIPLNIALQSNLFKSKINFARLSSSGLENPYEFNTEINSSYLNLLADALISLDEYKYPDNKRLLFEHIQNQLLTKFIELINQHSTYLPINEIFKLLQIANYWDLKILEELFIDLLAQQLINPDKTLNQNNLIGISNLFLNYDLMNKWYLVEKLYYLRSNELRPNIENLLLKYFSENFRNLLGINNENYFQKIEGFINNWELSINDLVDYQKNLILDENESLDLTDFFLSSIDGLQRIPYIYNTYKIDFSRNNISELGNNLNGLINLRTLILFKNQIKQLGNSLNGLKVSYIDLSYNQIKDLDNNLNGLDNLRELDLGHNLITQLGTSLKELINLDTLLLENNQITQLGTSLNKLINLDELDLSNNQIINLGNSLNRLIKLLTLKLQNNQIVDLGISLNKLINLQILDLSNNRIINLGISLNELVNLEELDLANNQIINLGNSLNTLIKLITLKLRNNQIINLGDGLNGLINLEYLDLRDNQIISLDNSFNGVVQLLVLKIANNQIVDLTNISQIILNLSQLKAENNPLNQESLQLIETFENQQEDEENNEDNNDVIAMELEENIN